MKVYRVHTSYEGFSVHKDFEQIADAVVHYNSEMTRFVDSKARKGRITAYALEDGKACHGYAADSMGYHAPKNWEI